MTNRHHLRLQLGKHGLAVKLMDRIINEESLDIRPARSVKKNGTRPNNLKIMAGIWQPNEWRRRKYPQ
eukprot:scaffold44490_cov55-Cyclotella_meneghiniana.AAC.1